jgi:hypothetical protein
MIYIYGDWSPLRPKAKWGYFLCPHLQVRFFSDDRVVSSPTPPISWDGYLRLLDGHQWWMQMLSSYCRLSETYCCGYSVTTIVNIVLKHSTLNRSGGLISKSRITVDTVFLPWVHSELLNRWKKLVPCHVLKLLIFYWWLWTHCSFRLHDKSAIVYESNYTLCMHVQAAELSADPRISVIPVRISAKKKITSVDKKFWEFFFFLGVNPSNPSSASKGQWRAAFTVAAR